MSKKHYCYKNEHFLELERIQIIKADTQKMICSGNFCGHRLKVDRITPGRGGLLHTELYVDT